MNEFETIYNTYRSHLFSIAYRMLGSISDAEDIVHEVFLHITQINIEQITDLKAYLSKMTNNRCLNLLQSARHRRETYVGPWLPEPKIQTLDQPFEKIIKDESISYAFLLLLEQLSPIERSVFVLRETLAYDYNEIANILDKTEVNCRKIFSRAKRKLNGVTSTSLTNSKQVDLLTKTFIQASVTGNFDQFINTLTEDVVLVTDGGGKVIAALNPIISKQRVSAFLQGIASKGSFYGELQPIIINGQSGVLHVQDGQPLKAIYFALDQTETNIKKIYIISNPDKLRHISLPL
ncbi:RNA polymerase [Bacillus solimangrovi]|uniref:RNA polymerase n=2 Tax=Bacillus solimangrovi TaxID=1305675 RepID=A0A1E5LJI2_9BACI|nr:RNA polymerase [Bacillus solimangrovi]